MKPINTFKLIEGDFSVVEAKELLTNLYSNKIQFHSSKNFSTQERFGHPHEGSLKRIPELKATLTEICQLLDALKQTDSRLNISANITIQINE
ncbi:MAG: hypothetical protein KGK14_10030 [Bacteroidota bacterium]|jgi:hypothetical protein|nr:hypothetical protein [Bacteroidota bacterium]